MSLYNDKIEKVRLAIIKSCNQGIEDNFHELNMWLSFEDWEFPAIYKKEFNVEFSQYISQSEETATFIYYAGMNLTYFVSTITSITKDMKKIKKLVDEFITTQIEDFDNACDYISMTMYEETNPDTAETAVPAVINLPGEDNPSNT
jgi:hypothetical protein